MAYEIRHKTDAEYHLIQFHGHAQLLESLQRTLRITDGVVRFRIIKLEPGTPDPPPKPERAPVEPAEAPAAAWPRRPFEPPRRLRRRSRPRRRSAVSPSLRDDSATKERRIRRVRGSRRNPGLHSPQRVFRRFRATPKGAVPRMAATNINRVIITGNLTSDPELRSLPSGTSVCKLRVACNTRRKDNSTGEWVDKPNYFDVTVWGAQGENCARYLSKGRPVAVDGRLEWREWEGAGRQQAPGDRHHRRRRPVPLEPARRRRRGRRATASAPGRTSPSTRTTSPPRPPAGSASSAPADDDIPF